MNINTYYKKLGIEPVISACGDKTIAGGTKLRKEIIKIMNESSQVMVDINELNNQINIKINKLIGSGGGLICSGSSGGLVLQAAAVIAGKNKNIMKKIPDTYGIKNEIIIQKSQLVSYSECYRAAGAKIVVIGNNYNCSINEFVNAFNKNTAAVAYTFSPGLSRQSLTLEQVIEISHKKEIPVIVNAASYLPPRENFTKYINLGADMVVFSGGKAIKGPQGTGFLIGKKKLIHSAIEFASPNEYIARCMKISKEEIIGAIYSLEIFLNEDEEEETKMYYKMFYDAELALNKLNNIDVRIVYDKIDFMIPCLVLKFTSKWNGLSRDDIHSKLLTSDPRIWLQNSHGADKSELVINPLNLNKHDLDIIVNQILHILH